MDGAAQAGGEPIGIGIPGLTPSLSYREMGFSIARLAGVSILHGGYIRLRSSGTDMGTADTVTITIASVQTHVIGDPALTMLEDAVIPTASIVDRDRQVQVSTPDPWWVALDAASEDLAAVDSTAEEAGSMVVVGSTEVAEEAGFTEVVEDSMVGDR